MLENSLKSIFDLSDDQILNLEPLELDCYPAFIKERSAELIKMQLEDNLLAQSIFWGPSDLDLQFSAILAQG